MDYRNIELGSIWRIKKEDFTDKGETFIVLGKIEDYEEINASLYKILALGMISSGGWWFSDYSLDKEIERIA